MQDDGEKVKWIGKKNFGNYFYPTRQKTLTMLTCSNNNIYLKNYTDIEMLVAIALYNEFWTK